MTIKRYHLKSLSILLLSVFACSKPQEKKEPARLAQTVRVYSRTAGPLEIEETHGVYANVMISVSDYGEYETNQVFTVGPFLGAKFKNGKDVGDHYEIEVHHGHDYKKKTRLAIYLDKVVMLKS